MFGTQNIEKTGLLFIGENYVIETPELEKAKNQLKQGMHTCLIMRTEHPRD